MWHALREMILQQRYCLRIATQSDCNFEGKYLFIGSKAEDSNSSGFSNLQDAD